MSAEPGWHPDPQTPEQLRYWDGHTWTHFTVRAPSVPPAVDLTPRRHRLLTVAIVLVVLLSSIGVLSALFSDDPATEPVTATDRIEPETDEEVTEASTPTPEPTPETAPVPKVVGQTVARARDNIEDTGLDVGSITKRTSVKRPGTVLRQSRRPDREMELGSSVHLVVAGPWPRAPRVLGMNSGVAIDKLRTAGFRVNTTLRRTTSGRDGAILSQVPAGGRTIKPRSTIRLVVADLQKPDPPPPPPPPSNCTTGYSPCLPPASDYDCAGGSGDGPAYAQGPITITGSDPYDLDRDGDGIACES